VHLTETTALKARAFGDKLLESGMVSVEYAQSVSSVARTIVSDNVIYPQVALTVVPGIGIVEYWVRETLPVGLTPRSISEGGVWDGVNGQLSWGPFTDAKVRELSYSVAGSDGTYALPAVNGLGGSTLDMMGVSELTLNHAADIDELDDVWEMSHFGSLEQTGAGDFDGDGLNNLAECQNGSDPCVAWCLKPGWNLVSIPQRSEAATVKSVFNADEILCVWSWNADDQVYEPGESEEILDSLKGYWIYTVKELPIVW
jgi:hypothetical protein